MKPILSVTTTPVQRLPPSADLSLVGHTGRRDTPALRAKLERLRAEARGFAAARSVSTPLGAADLTVYPVEQATAKAIRDGLDPPAKRRRGGGADEVSDEHLAVENRAAQISPGIPEKKGAKTPSTGALRGVLHLRAGTWNESRVRRATGSMEADAGRRSQRIRRTEGNDLTSSPIEDLPISRKAPRIPVWPQPVFFPGRPDDELFDLPHGPRTAHLPGLAPVVLPGDQPAAPAGQHVRGRYRVGPRQRLVPQLPGLHCQARRLQWAVASLRVPLCPSCRGSSCPTFGSVAGQDSLDPDP